MKRREFVALLGGATAWPLLARAQPATLPAIGFFSPNTALAASSWTAAFVQRLRELGWIEGLTVTIAKRWGDGRVDRAAEFVADFVGLKADVIVTHGESNVFAAKQATSIIPIVFALATDPIGSGFVANLARPGGNLTGMSIQAPDLVGKRLDLLHEVLPGLKRLAIMTDGNRGTMLEMNEVQAVARALGIDAALTLEIKQAEEITPAFHTLQGRVDALYICAVPLVNTNRVSINALALAAQLPTMHGFREAVEANGLMSYGPNFPDLFRRTADYVDKILRGAKPADLPVEQPTKYDLVFNLKIAKALGLAIPETFLLRADEVIE
jgi:putative ABC transport system substrate-binding protein